jgi:hypothetical protein
MSRLIAIGRRASGGETSPADPFAGWTRRFTALLARAEEAAEIYRELGLEVWLVDDEDPRSAECGDCHSSTKTIYTRESGGRR